MIISLIRSYFGTVQSHGELQAKDGTLGGNIGNACN